MERFIGMMKEKITQMKDLSAHMAQNAIRTNLLNLLGVRRPFVAKERFTSAVFEGNPFHYAIDSARWKVVQAAYQKENAAGEIIKPLVTQTTFYKKIRLHGNVIGSTQSLRTAAQDSRNNSFIQWQRPDGDQQYGVVDSYCKLQDLTELAIVNPLYNVHRCEDYGILSYRGRLGATDCIKLAWIKALIGLLRIVRMMGPLRLSSFTMLISSLVSLGNSDDNIFKDTY